VTSDAPPVLVRKPFTSFLVKTLRKNVLDNRSWPENPEGGWIEPQNWYARVNDIIRTTLVVKYMDGVSFLAEKICGHLDAAGVWNRIDYEAKEDGYYAGHLYFRHDVNIPKPDWGTKTVPVMVELQITTQLQDVIRALTHAYYNERRVRATSADIKWQWDYASDEFVPNYLGHILHYMEGMIMEVRDRGKAGDGHH
jgi:ppGpp synthetase/RelA/SpoT-type nucleotidyltranferase